MPPQSEPLRTCVGCRQESGKSALIRVIRKVGGGAAIDQVNAGQSRGAYLHPDPECIALARKKGTLERALRTAIQRELWPALSAEATRY